MARPRAERPGELDELRRLNAALAELRERRQHHTRGSYAQARDGLRRARAAEVRRLRTLPLAPWSHGELADVLGVSRASIQQWENPNLDRRRPGISPGASAWLAAGAAVAGGCAVKHVVCAFCRHVVAGYWPLG